MPFANRVWRPSGLNSTTTTTLENLLFRSFRSPKAPPPPRHPPGSSALRRRFFGSSNSKPRPHNHNHNTTGGSGGNSTSSSSSSASASAGEAEAARRTRLSRILDRALRWTPRRLRPYGERLRSAPLSHVVAFLVLHEATAIAPLFGLVALFKWAGWVPSGVVLGPWAAWAQEGLHKYFTYFRKKGWFGLHEGDDAGEAALEGQLGEEVSKLQRKREKRDGSDSTVADSSRSRWYAPWRGKGRVKEDAGSAAEVVAPDESKTGKAWRKVKEVVTLGNMETGYNTGIQIAAAYTITKALFPVRIAFSIWATPWGARLISAAWKAMRGKP